MPPSASGASNAPTTTAPGPRHAESWFDRRSEVASIRAACSAIVENAPAELRTEGEPTVQSFPETERREQLHRKAQKLLKDLRPHLARLGEIKAAVELSEHPGSSAAGSLREECKTEATALWDEIQRTNRNAIKFAQITAVSKRSRQPVHPQHRNPSIVYNFGLGRNLVPSRSSAGLRSLPMPNDPQSPFNGSVPHSHVRLREVFPSLARQSQPYLDSSVSEFGPTESRATLSRLLLGRRQPRSIPVSDRFLPHPHFLGLFDGCSEVQDLRYPIPTIPVPREAEMGDVMGKD